MDNYGDAGVCWRLARQLAVEHGWRLRLFIDDPATLARLGPDLPAVEILPWPDAETEAADVVADVVVEAFACELPDAYLAAMARRPRAPVWINLEYLSAETWVAACHALPSPHPRLPLTKHFFFPGFAPGTGGLLRERDYAARRAVFNEDRFREEFGLPPRLPDELCVSLFSYPNPALAGLRQAWAESPTPIRVLAPGSAEPVRREGNLHWHPLPFVPQRRYDEILWACDLNFVRGEDSFVRAQWAAKPFVWHIYPQDADAHLVKLRAFLARYLEDDALWLFWQAWNGQGKLDWPEFAAALPRLETRARAWAAELAARQDLASALVDFSLERLK